MHKYRTRPSFVEAAQIGATRAEVLPVVYWVESHGRALKIKNDETMYTAGEGHGSIITGVLSITTEEDDLLLDFGTDDWILRDDQGQFCVYDDYLFKIKYEEAQ